MRGARWIGLLLLLLLDVGCATRSPPIPDLWRGEPILARPDGSEIIHHLKTPEQPGDHPVVVYLDGSGCRTVMRVFMSNLDPLVATGAAVVAIEKRGVVDAGTRCSDEFLRTNDRHQRLADTRQLLDALDAIDPLWDGRVFLIGASEGAQIAPQLAAEYPCVAGLVLLGGGGLAQHREIELLAARHAEQGDAAPKDLDADLTALREEFDAIQAEPDSTRTWRGRDNTYRRWASYLWYAPLDHLLQCEVPMLLVHGVFDESSPVESADVVAAEFAGHDKHNLTYWRLDTNHGFVQPDGTDESGDVIRGVVRWLREQGLLPGPSGE